MEMTSPRLQTASPKRYHMANSVLVPRALTALAALAAAPIILAAIGEEIDGVVIGMFGVLIAICMVIFFAVARMSWITLDENGIVYKALGFKLTSTWDNIDSIGKRFMQNEGNVEGLVLIKSGLDVNGAIKAGSLLSWRATLALRELEYFIPLSNFQTKQWRDTEFGREIRRYAPHLFEGE